MKRSLSYLSGRLELSFGLAVGIGEQRWKQVNED